MRTVGPWERIATTAELLAAARHPQVTVGLHTWGHPNLALLGPAEVSEEVAQCADWLRHHLPDTRPWLAFPYGRFDLRNTSVLARCGIERAFRVDGGWYRPPTTERLNLPRMNVPAGISDRGFLLRTSGALGS